MGGANSVAEGLFICILFCTVPGGSGQDRTCSVTSDCQSDECCLSTSTTGWNGDDSGYCKPIGVAENMCYVKNNELQAPTSEILYLDACPCVPGLRCVSNGAFEVPEEEKGICRV